MTLLFPLSEVEEGAQDHEEVVQLANSLILVAGDGSFAASQLGEDGGHSSHVAAVSDLAVDPLGCVLEASLDHAHVDRDGPGGHTAGVAILSDLSGDLLQHVLDITLVALSRDVESGGISVVGRGAALLGVDRAQLSTLLDQGNLHGAVGAEESGVLAVLVNVDLDVLGDPSLCAGDTSIAGGIGSGSFDILDAQLSAASLEASLTAGDGSVAQMTLEGDVDESLSTLSSSLVDDSGTHCDLVDQQDHVSSSSDDSGVLSSDTCDEQDVVTGLLDLVDGSGHAGNSLTDDDSLHIGISSHVGDGSDGLLGLGGEVRGTFPLFVLLRDTPVYKSKYLCTMPKQSEIDLSSTSVYNEQKLMK